MKLNPCKKCGSVSYGYVALVQERNDNLRWYGAICRLCGRAVQTDPNDSDTIEIAMWLFPQKEDAIAAWNAANPVEEKEPEINPCVCGGVADLCNMEGTGWTVECNGCLRVATGLTADDAIEHWNQKNGQTTREYPHENCPPTCAHLVYRGGPSDGACAKYKADLDFHDWFFKCKECLNVEPKPTTKPHPVYIEDRIKELERRVRELERAEKENKSSGSD